MVNGGGWSIDNISGGICVQAFDPAAKKLKLVQFVQFDQRVYELVSFRRSFSFGKPGFDFFND
jgi:hypothetical protein